MASGLLKYGFRQSKQGIFRSKNSESVTTLSASERPQKRERILLPKGLVEFINSISQLDEQ